MSAVRRAATATMTLLFGRCPCCDAKVARVCADAEPDFREPGDLMAVRHTCGSELGVDGAGTVRGRVPCTVAWGVAVRALQAEVDEAVEAGLVADAVRPERADAPIAMGRAA